MIDDTIKELEKDYKVSMVSDVPLYGGQHQYVVNMTTRPLYSQQQKRMFSIKELTDMEVDVKGKTGVAFYVCRDGKTRSYSLEGDKK